MKELTKKIVEEKLELIHRGELYYDLDLNDYNVMTTEAAKLIATKFKGIRIELSGIRHIIDEVASALVSSIGELSSLSFNGLTSISDNASTTLARVNARSLHLDGLESISDNAAKAFVECQFDLSLEGLINISNNQAFHLSMFQGPLTIGKNPEVPRHIQEIIWGDNFSGLYLTDEIIEILSSFSGKSLHLHIWEPKTITSKSVNLLISNNKIKGLSKDLYQIARKMQMNKGDAEKYATLHYIEQEKFLYTFKSLTVDAAQILSFKTLNQVLDLRFIKSLEEDVAKELVKYKGGLNLNGLKNVTSNLAKILITHKGMISRGQIGPKIHATLELDGLKEISSEIAIILISYEGSLSLNGLKNIDDKTAQILLRKSKLYDTVFKKEYQPSISLNSLNFLSKSTSEILANYPDKKLYFSDEFKLFCIKDKNALANWFEQDN
jgi:hypothetical protein